MQGKYKVVTLCGSTRFKEEFVKAQKDLTLQDNIVISVGLFGHSGDNEVWTDDTKEMLGDMHKRKIDMADEIFIINVDGYIGESTRSEIEYAKEHNKPVRYLVQNIDTPNAQCKGLKNIKLTEKEFIEKYCKKCGSQRCEGIGTDWFDGCQHRYELENYTK